MVHNLSISHLSKEMKDCIDNCLSCHAVCLNTVQFCLQKGGKHAEQNHIRLMLDCAEICQVSANFMLRGSQLHSETCRVCATVCQRCADDCAKMGDDDQMRACAEMCRRCVETCKHMAA